MKTITNKTLYFIHANGFVPNAYSPLLSVFASKYCLKNYLLLDFFKNNSDVKIKNWIPIQDEFIKFINDKKIIGMGHSIGGNIILRSALTNPELFHSIILLDPTLFVPRIIFFWKLFKHIGLQEKIHPWLKNTLNRKMEYNDLDEIFSSYRRKNVFKNINDENLKIYINSLTIKINHKYIINYPRDIEYQIYKTGLVADNFIWKNLSKLNIPTLIIRAEHSNAFLKNSAKKVKSTNKNINIVTLDNTTHLFPFERPSKTATIISDFIRRH